MLSTYIQPMLPGILAVWNAIAPDVDLLVESNEEAIEMCLDADHLETFSSKVDNDLLKNLLEDFSIDEIIAAVAAELTLV